MIRVPCYGQREEQREKEFERACFHVFFLGGRQSSQWNHPAAPHLGDAVACHAGVFGSAVEHAEGHSAGYTLGLVGKSMHVVHLVSVLKADPGLPLQELVNLLLTAF